MDVSKNIRLIRESRNLTQVEVAAKLGTERSNYARLENRGENLTIKQITEIATALEVTIYDILGEPDVSGLSIDHSEKINTLEDKLRTTEEILREKRRNIKLYKSFIEWIREKFEAQLVLSTLGAAAKLELREVEFENDEDVSIDRFDFSEEELKSLGDHLLSYEATDYFLNQFIAESGFIKHKWFIDAYKRASRKRKEKVSYAEVKNWVESVFEFLEDE